MKPGTKAFMGATYQPNYMDVQHGQMWDSVRFREGVVRGGIYRLFSVPEGQMDSIGALAKTLNDTSMVKSCQLPAPEAFALQRLVFTFDAASSDADVIAFTEECVFEFIIGRKFYLRCPLGLLVTDHRCPKCEQIYFGNGGCPKCDDAQYRWAVSSGINPGRQYVMDLDINLIIDNQATFYVDLHCDDSITIKKPMRLWCHMEGLHARGVQ